MNSHHHEDQETEKEALKSIRQYWKEPSKYEFQAEIVETNDDWIRLNKSYFYPEGGGQQSDRGILKSGNQEYLVIDVQEMDKEIWINVPSHNYEIGNAVEGLIDGQRRQSLSRNHSTQHLISAVFWDAMECDTTRAEITTKESQVEIDTSLELQEIYRVFNRVSDLINENLPIKSLFFSAEKINRSILRGQIGKQDIYRIVTIGSLDYNACGGTHIGSTSEISELLLTKVEGRKMKFITGDEAKSQINKQIFAMFDISRVLNSPVKNSLNKVKELIVQKIQLEKKVVQLNQQVTEHTIQERDWINCKDLQFKAILVSEIHKSQVLEIVQPLTKSQFLLCFEQGGKFILTSGDTSLTQHIFSKLKELGAQGGGRDISIMGLLSQEYFANIDGLLSKIIEDIS